MWKQFVIYIQKYWHNLELVYGYSPVLRSKEWIEHGSIFFIGVILMYLVNSWFFSQYKRSDIVKGLSAMRVGDETYSNPHTLVGLIDTYIGIIYLKLHPDTDLRKKDLKLARNIMYLIFTMLVILTIIGFVTASIITLPYGGVRP